MLRGDEFNTTVRCSIGKNRQLSEHKKTANVRQKNRLESAKMEESLSQHNQTQPEGIVTHTINVCRLGEEKRMQMVD